ncbi:MAG: thymidine phosphorylase [Bacillota bacterium]|nr:thymidine phosphorylase [Bacillota bacterium]
MNPVDLIIKKRDGGFLTDKEMQFFIDGAAHDSWPDYQLSAMLMALFLRGMTPAETAAMTLAMASSGDQFDLSAIPGIKVDKHSTGGVADTTTLVLVPLVAACGVPTVKISGRGLGFTGGTIDKLESIPGFRVSIDACEAIELVRRSGLVVMAQTDRLTPADKKLYALRDVTGTVDSIPLIAASIMSKKIAAGADAIVLDVKCGNGAFMRDADQARELAVAMVEIGRQVGLRVVAVISSMEQPLGNYIGNTLEVFEAIDVLKGQTGGDLLELAYVLGAEMLMAAQAAPDLNQARQMLEKALANGAGLAKFADLIKGQGGDPRIIDSPDLLPQPAYRRTVQATQSGYLTAIDTARLGRLFVELGGGRKTKTDPIDYTAGMVLLTRLGQRVHKGDPLVHIQATDAAKVDLVAAELPSVFKIADEPVAAAPLIIDIIRSDDLSNAPEDYPGDAQSDNLKGPPDIDPKGALRL